MSNPQILEDNEDKIIEYLNLKLEHVSDNEIARIWHISRPTLYRWKERNGIRVGGGRHPQQTLRMEDLTVEGMDVKGLLEQRG